MEYHELIEKINQKKEINIIGKNLQYREAILEILEKTKKIDFIFISEKTPGQISVEKLIKKIKYKNPKIEIIFFLEKEDKKKENKLKEIGIKNIYYHTNKNNLNIIINKLEIKEGNINKNNKLIINKNNSKIISIIGKLKTGKTTIAFLIILYLIQKNKKILLINLNKKIENNYLILLGKKYYKIKEKNEIKINKNLTFIYQSCKNKNNQKEKYDERNLRYIFQRYKKNYEYIIVDIGFNTENEIREQILEKSYKKLFVMGANLLGIEEIEQNKENYLKEKQKEKNSLHIIQNQYCFNSISFLITKNILKKYFYVSKIPYKIKYKNLAENIFNKQEIKIDKKTKNKIKKIIGI